MKGTQALPLLLTVRHEETKAINSSSYVSNIKSNHHENCCSQNWKERSVEYRESHLIKVELTAEISLRVLLGHKKSVRDN